MKEEALRQLSKEQLIVLVLQQQKMLDGLRKQNEEVKKGNQALMLRVKELEAKVEGASQPAKTAANSSVPPSASRKTNRSEKRRRERKHREGAGMSRKRVEPDVMIECMAEQCADCGADLRGVPQRLLGRSQVVEIPPVEPVVVEAQRYGCTCPQCGKAQSGVYPAGMEAERVFGSRLEAMVSYLHEVHHLSYQRLQTVLRVLFGVRISAGALVNMVGRVAERLQPTAEAIREQIRGSPVVGSDETGARINGRNHWQWVFVTEQATYHIMASSRGSQVIAEMMGDAQPLVWISDMWSAQLKAKAKQRQLCLAHQLRDLQYAIDADGSAWAYQMQRFFRTAIRLWKRRDSLPAKQFDQAVQQAEAKLDDLLQQRARGPQAQRLRDRYRLHRQSLLVFLHVPGVPPDNNASERALRNSVIHRKVMGSFRSQQGADAHATVASVVDTARKQGKDIFATLMSHLAPTASIPNTHSAPSGAR